MTHRQSGWIKAVGVILLILFGAFVLLIYIPVSSDRDTRALATVGVNLGAQVADRLLAAGPGRFREVEDGAKYLPGGEKNVPAHVERIQVIKDGVVRVSFKSPDELAGKAVEIHTTGKDGRFMRECRSLGINEKLLPAACRSGFGPFPVEGLK